MKSEAAMIAWTPDREPFLDNPTRGQVKVIEFLAERDDKNFTHTIGACDSNWEEIGVSGRQLQIEHIFQQMINGDNIDPLEARSALSRLDDIFLG